MLSTKKIMAGISLGLVGMVLMQVLAGFLANPIIELNQNFGIVVFLLLYNALVLLLAIGIIKKFLGGQLEDYGLGKQPIKKDQFILGLALPLIIFSTLVLLFSGHWQGVGSEVSAKVVFFELLLYVGLSGAVAEEIIFRGLIYHLLRKKLSFLPATTISSFIFAVIHIFNGGWTTSDFLFFCLLSVTLGIYLAYLTEDSGNVWGAAWVHYVWNVVNSSIATGTDAVENSLVSYIIEGGSPYLTGSVSGPLFTVSGFLVLLVTCLFYAWKLRRVR